MVAAAFRMRRWPGRGDRRARGLARGPENTYLSGQNIVIDGGFYPRLSRVGGPLARGCDYRRAFAHGSPAS